jgi:predicted O-methyltransferase YrrM
VAELIRVAASGRLEPGWRGASPELVAEQCRLSRALTRSVTTLIEQRFRELDATLRGPSAAALDVGAGGGAVCIGLCEAYPRLRVVGLEPARVPHDLATRNVAEAGLGARIALRRETAENLTDTECYDLAYVAHMFIPDAPLTAALPRVRDALRPGGWLMTTAVDARRLDSPLVELRHLSRGATRSSQELARMLAAAGYRDVVIHPRLAGSMDGITARR